MIQIEGNNEKRSGLGKRRRHLLAPALSYWIFAEGKLSYPLSQEDFQCLKERCDESEITSNYGSSLFMKKYRNQPIHNRGNSRQPSKWDVTLFTLPQNKYIISRLLLDHTHEISCVTIHFTHNMILRAYLLHQRNTNQ